MKVENGVLLKVEEFDIRILEEKPNKFWKGVTAIGYGAFSHCSSLTSITLPSSITAIGGYAFTGCSRLTSITIPESVTEIGSWAFSNCSSLTSVTIPSSITAIGSYAFTGCSSLISVTILSSITAIGNDAFSNFSSLTSITIPESVAAIGDHAFSGCSSLTNVTIPESVTAIGDDAFRGCSSLTSITIPEGVTAIGKFAFSNCSSLTSITIPESVTEIGEYAFYGCSSLTSITIPSSITAIGGDAFLHCSSLTSITIPESVTAIGGRAFRGCSSLTSITIPEGVTAIGEFAFCGCSSLTNITIPESVTQIGKGAFYGVKNVKFKDVNISGDLLTPEVFEYIKNNPNADFKQMNRIYQLAKNKGLNINNFQEFINLCVNIGMIENKTKQVEIGKLKNGQPNLVPVSTIAYTFMQGILNHDDLNLSELHMHLQALKMDGYNQEFAKFVTNKTNWSDIKENLELLPRIYDWFKFRTELNLQQSNNSLLPTREEDRFKVLVYETSENGVDRMHWRAPTVEYLKKEFAQTKFSGIVTQRDKEIAESISKYNIYEQKHFDKAKEIDKEREESGVKDILAKPIKQDRIKSLDEYRERTRLLKEQILKDGSEILYDQIEDTSSVFTYEVLSKSDPANFSMGCMTSCCATLYGAGAGAMRAMIIHPDIQPLVIRDFDNNIISFGIIYVNRKEGYAVVNDFEVNKKYIGKDDKRKAIYDKAMEGVRAFVEEYNRENSQNPIKVVTCGRPSIPNWIALNDFIEKNPKSEILKAPNFNDFKYAGSGSWPGDWHRNQYVIWQMEEMENER